MKEVASSPWCNCIDDDRPFGGDLIFIEIHYNWLPEGFGTSNFCSARGKTFKDALEDLRENLWNWLRDPATGEPISRTPADWIAAGFSKRVKYDHDEDCESEKDAHVLPLLPKIFNSAL